MLLYGANDSLIYQSAKETDVYCMRVTFAHHYGSIGLNTEQYFCGTVLSMCAQHQEIEDKRKNIKITALLEKCAFYAMRLAILLVLCYSRNIGGSDIF